MPRDRPPAAPRRDGGSEPVTLPPGIRRADVPALVLDTERALGDALADGLVCDAGNDAHPSLATVDLLARLSLTARRHGATVRIEHASPELLELLGLCGFEGVLEVLVEPGDAPTPTPD